MAFVHEFVHRSVHINVVYMNINIKWECASSNVCSHSHFVRNIYTPLWLQRLLPRLTGISSCTVSLNWEQNVVCLKSKINPLQEAERRDLHRRFPFPGSAVLWAIEREWLAAGTQLLGCSASSIHQHRQESQDKETSPTCLGPCVLIRKLRKQSSSSSNIFDLEYVTWQLTNCDFLSYTNSQSNDIRKRAVRESDQLQSSLIKLLSSSITQIQPYTVFSKWLSLNQGSVTPVSGGYWPQCCPKQLKDTELVFLP